MLSLTRAAVRPVLSRSLALRAGTASSVHTLPDLPYAYDVRLLPVLLIHPLTYSCVEQALEPHISSQIMELHHSKHHQTYVNGLNAAEKSYSSAISSDDVKAQIKLQSALKFNGGGHINHSLFWKNLAPSSQGGGKLSDGKLKNAIESDFGSVEKFKEAFNAQTAAIQGSGWGWLGYNETTKKLEIVTTANQDPLVCTCYAWRPGLAFSSLTSRIHSSRPHHRY